MHNAIRLKINAIYKAPQQWLIKKHGKERFFYPALAKTECLIYLWHIIL